MAALDAAIVGLLWVLGLGSVVTAVSLVLFDVLRPRIPDLYDRRRAPPQPLGFGLDDGRRGACPPPSLRPLAWIPHVLRVRDEDLEASHGLDAVMMLRFYRGMMVLCAVLSAFGIVFLIPVYISAGNKNLPASDPLKTIGVRMLSLANVPTDDWRMNVVVAADIVIAALVLCYIITEAAFLARLRRKYRTSDHISNYAVLVQDVPTAFANNTDLFRFWSVLFPDRVVSATMIPRCQKLDALRSQFWTIVRNRERAEALIKPMPSDEFVAQDAEKGVTGFSGLDPSAIDTALPSSTVQMHAHDSKNASAESRSTAASDQPTLACALRRRSRSSWGAHLGKRPTHRPGSLGFLRVWDDPVDSVEYWTRKQDETSEKVRFAMLEDEQYPTGAAVVLFKKKSIAAMAAQANIAAWQMDWKVSRAPEPNAISWDHFGKHAHTVIPRKVVTTVLTVALTIFWVIPTAAIQSVANIESLSKISAFSWLSFVNSLTPEVTGFITDLLPAIILEIVMIVVPILLRKFVLFQRIPSLVEVEIQVLRNMITFLYFSHLIYVVLAGSLLEYVDDIVKNPSDILKLLSSSIPVQSSFFVNLIFLATMVQVPFEIVQPTRLIRRWFGMRHARTRRDRELVNSSDSSTEYFSGYAFGTIYVVLGIVYSSLAPLVIVFCTAFFCATYVVSKYNIMYTFTHQWEGYAALHPVALQGIAFGLFVKQVTMTGVLLLSGHFALGIIELLLGILVIALIVVCGKRLAHICEHGALSDMVMAPSDDGEATRTAPVEVTDEIEEGACEEYNHPSYDPLPEVI